MVSVTGAGKYASQLLKADCASYTQRAPAHYKGPLDHLFVIRYACFVPVVQIMQINRLFTLSPNNIRPLWGKP